MPPAALQILRPLRPAGSPGSEFPSDTSPFPARLFRPGQPLPPPVPAVPPAIPEPAFPGEAPGPLQAASPGRYAPRQAAERKGVLGPRSPALPPLLEAPQCLWIPFRSESASPSPWSWPHTESAVPLPGSPGQFPSESPFSEATDFWSAFLCPQHPCQVPGPGG